MSSIYPEKWVFDGEKHRTPEINEAAQLIYHINRRLRHKKTGVKSLTDFYSGEVFSEIQNSNFFIEDLQNAAGLEDESFNPLPPGLIGLA